MTHSHLSLNFSSANQNPPPARESTPLAPQPPVILPSPPNTQQSQQPSIPQGTSGSSSGPTLSTISVSQQWVQDDPPLAGTSSGQNPQGTILAHPSSADTPQSEREAHWLVEIACLHSLLNLKSLAVICPPLLLGTTLYESPEAVDHVKLAIAASKDTKKTILPDVIPGFKAASTDFGSLLHYFHLYMTWWKTGHICLLLGWLKAQSALHQSICPSLHLCALGTHCSHYKTSDY